MKISQKLENACRVLVHLAQAYDSQKVCRVDELARREGLSANFLLQILNDLRRAGLVLSKRGKFGGYILARPAATITLRAIVEAVDGLPAETGAGAEGEAGPRVARAWAEVSRRFVATLDAITLEEISRPADDPGMFYI